MFQFQTLGMVSDGQVNILGALQRSKVNIFQQFSKKSRKTKYKKWQKNGNFYAKPVFDQIDFLYGCNSKTSHYKYLKFSPNFYVSVIYIQLNFQKFLTFFELFIDHRNFRFFWEIFFEVSIKKFWMTKKFWKFNTRFLTSCF